MEAGPTPLPPTSPTPPVEEGSRGTNTDANKSNAHLALKDQPHPTERARKCSDADAASVMSVCEFHRVVLFFFVDSVTLTIHIFCVQQEPYSTSYLTLLLAVNGVLTNPTPSHTHPSTSGLPTTASLTATQRNFRAE